MINLWWILTIYYSIGDINSDFLSWEKTPMVVLSSSGNVIFVPPVTYKTRCAPQWQNLPWGSHNCSLTFGSWTYSMKDVNIIEGAQGVDSSYFEESDVRFCLSFGGYPSKYWLAILFTVIGGNCQHRYEKRGEKIWLLPWCISQLEDQYCF